MHAGLGREGFRVGQEWNQKSFLFMVCQITGKASVTVAGSRQCTGCAGRHSPTDISLSPAIAPLANNRDGSEWCISVSCSELEKVLCINPTLWQWSRVAWLNQGWANALGPSRAGVWAGLWAAGLLPAPSWAPVGGGLNSPVIRHLHIKVWEEKAHRKAGLAPPLPSHSGVSGKLQRWVLEGKTQTTHIFYTYIWCCSDL